MVAPADSAGPLFDEPENGAAVYFVQVPEDDIFALEGDAIGAGAVAFLRAWSRAVSRVRRPAAWVGWPTDPVAALARWARSDETTARRTLRRLAGLGVVRVTPGNRFHPAELAWARMPSGRLGVELAEARARAAENPGDQRSPMPVENGNQRSPMPDQRSKTTVDSYLGLHTAESPPPPRPSPDGDGKAVRRSTRRASPGPLPAPAAGTGVRPSTSGGSDASLSPASPPTRTEPVAMGDPSPSGAGGDVGEAPRSAARWAEDPTFREELAARTSPELAAVLRRMGRGRGAAAG